MDFRLLALYIHAMVHVNMVDGASNYSTPAHELWKELFVTRGYNSKIRPVFDPDYVTNMTSSLFLKSINSFDEVSGILKVSVFMFIDWKDEFLTWNSYDYGNITLARWSQDDVWTPDVILYNSVNSYHAIGHKTILVENFDDGHMTWAPMELFETACPVDMTYYPFDIQTCELQFMSWSYTNYVVKLDVEYDSISLEDYSSNAEWDILSTRATLLNDSYAPVDIISFSIKLQRKPQHHLLTLFLPVILLAVLDIFVFALPSDGGEKAGYAVTVFLAFAVFLTIVDTTMPANSEKVSLFSVYVVVQTAQSTLITIIALLLIRCASINEGTPVPNVFATIVRISHCTTCRNKTTRTNQVGNDNKDADVRSIVTEHDFSSVSVLKDTELCSWKMVADAADRICFVIFAAIFLISTAVCFSVLTSFPK